MAVIQTRYNIKDKVNIIALDVIGIIVGFYYGDFGLQYQVAYFVDGSRKNEPLFEEEISTPTGKEKTGFNT